MIKNKLYVYDEGKVEVPAHMNFGQEILDSMMKNKDIIALINADTNKRLTYGELAQQTVDVALSLARMGIGKGDVVSICSENCFEFMATVLGIICAGATCAPTVINAIVLHQLNIARPKVLFCSSTAYKAHIEAFRTVDSIKTYIVFGDEARPGAILFKDFLTEHVRVEDFQPVPVDELNDIIMIRFTSGTTGLPKGIAVRQLNVINCVRNFIIDSVPGKTILNTRDWYSPYGLTLNLLYLTYGSTVIYCPKYSVVEFLEAIQKYKIQRIQLTPPLLNEFVKSSIVQDYDVTSVELILSSTNVLKKDALVAVSKIFSGLDRVTQFYGMSEVGSVCSDHRVPYGTKPGSVGVPLPGFVIKVVDLDTRVPLGPNQRGEICLRAPPTVISEYIGADIPKPFDEEGFFKTGDLGYYDEDRCFYIVDRIKEMLRFNDILISPAEYEALVQQHPSVLEAGVVGTPHECGQAPLALVVIRPGATVTDQELVDHVNRQVPTRVYLAGGVRFVSSLPKACDKLDRRALKQMVN